MGNNNATVSATEAPKPAELITDLHRKFRENADREENPLRRSGPLLRRNSSIRTSMRKNRQMGRRNFLLRRKTRAPPRRSSPTPDEKEFLAAAARGDLDGVLGALRNGVGLETADANEMTALHHAAKHAREDVVRSLLDRGADPNATDLTGGFTPLHWVIINSCPPIGSTNHVDESVIALARAGCDLNSTDFNLATPLHIAAQKGHKSTIDTLVRLGAKPQAKDVMGRSCLDIAKNEETREFIQSLHSKKESVIYHVLEVPTSSSRSPSPPALPEPAKKPRLSPVSISKDSSPCTNPDSGFLRKLPQFQRPPDSPGYPAPPPPKSPTPHSRMSTPEYSVVDVPLPYKYRPLPLLPTQTPSPLYRYNAAYSSPIPPPPHAIARRRASRKISSNASSRPHRRH